MTKKLKFCGLTIIYKFPHREVWEIWLGYKNFVFYKIIPNIRQQFRNLFIEEREDIDCDGITINIVDRLTKGKIYHFYGWNFRKVDGTCGNEVKWFDLRY